MTDTESIERIVAANGDTAERLLQACGELSAAANKLAAVRDAMCRCESIAEQIVKELTGPLRVCMDAIHKCDVTTKAT